MCPLRCSIVARMDGWLAVIGFWNDLGRCFKHAGHSTDSVTSVHCSSRWKLSLEIPDQTLTVTPWLQTPPTWKAKATNAAANCCKKWTKDLWDMAQSISVTMCRTSESACIDQTSAQDPRAASRIYWSLSISRKKHSIPLIQSEDLTKPLWNQLQSLLRDFV